MSSWGDQGLVSRYDPIADAWEIGGPANTKSSGGVAQSADGTVWVAAYWDSPFWFGVVGFDPETLDVVDTLALPSTGGGIPKGVSMDVDGYLWAVTYAAAYRIDTTTKDREQYDGLDSPYTYSDMTGGALLDATCTPEG